MIRVGQTNQQHQTVFTYTCNLIVFPFIHQISFASIVSHVDKITITFISFAIFSKL